MLVFVNDLFLCLKYGIQSRKNKALGDVWFALFSMASYLPKISISTVKDVTSVTTGLFSFHLPPGGSIVQ